MRINPAVALRLRKMVRTPIGIANLVLSRRGARVGATPVPTDSAIGPPIAAGSVRLVVCIVVSLRDRSGTAYPWVEPHVEQIDEQVRGQHRERDHQENPLHQGV